MDYRWLPKVNKLVQRVQELQPGTSEERIVSAARSVLERYRARIGEGSLGGMTKSELEQCILGDTLTESGATAQLSLRRVINATGVVLHTNLGRSVLAREAVQAVAGTAAGYCNLEMDLESGKRSSRYDHVSRLLAELTGAEDAIAVNNNAAALMLVLNEMAAGGEAIVSRGQLVEIGDGFRIPEIMQYSGVVIREVGTTNKTHPADYERAVCDQTRLILQVHPSNFRQIGFTSQVPLAELVAIGRDHGVPVVSDLGSGCFYPFAAMGIGEEPVVSEAIRSGADVLTFSGDKMLGGPQAGIILGKREWIARIRRNPLTRALRIDKFTLAALEATLRIYREKREAEEVPTVSMILATPEKIKTQADWLMRRLDRARDFAQIRLREGVSPVGGGALPGVELKTWTVEVSPNACSAADLLAALRVGTPSVLGYIRENRAYFDLRTVAKGEADILAARICACLEE